MYCWSGCWFFKKHFEAIHVLYSVQWDSWILCGKKHFKSTDSSSASTGKILGPSFIQVGAKVQCRIPVSVIQAVQCCAENWAPSASQQGPSGMLCFLGTGSKPQIGAARSLHGFCRFSWGGASGHDWPHVPSSYCLETLLDLKPWCGKSVLGSSSAVLVSIKQLSFLEGRVLIFMEKEMGVLQAHLI